MYPMHPSNSCLVAEIIAFLSTSLGQNKKIGLSLKIVVKTRSVIFRRVPPSPTPKRDAIFRLNVPSSEDHKRKTQFRVPTQKEFVISEKSSLIKLWM